MYNVYELLRFQARCRPDAPFVILNEHSLSYGQVYTKTETMIEFLSERGIRSSDHVAVCCEKPEDYLIAVLAIWGAQAIVVPIDASLLMSEKETLFQISRANWLLEPCTMDGELCSLKALLPRDETFIPEDRVAQLLFTSGSSGVPKAVILTHDSLIAAAIECADSIGLKPDDVQMTTVPFSHAYGQNRGLNATMFAGAAIAPVFEDDLGSRISALNRIRPTVLLSMAGFYGFLAFSKQDLGGRLRVAIAGAAPLPEAVLTRFENLYGFPLMTTYGLTEFLLISCQRLFDRRTPGTVGYPSRGVSIRIVGEDGNLLAPGEQGRILVRGCLAMKGYLGSADKKLSEDGWLDTEDIGVLDDTGLRVLGRASSFIKRSGYKVYPAEVQNCLADHPDVVDLAVAKYVSMLGGEELAVEIVLKKTSDTTTDDLLQFCRDRLPAYKVPAKFMKVQTISRLPSGKPDLVRIGRLAAGATK